MLNQGTYKMTLWDSLLEVPFDILPEVEEVIKELKDKFYYEEGRVLINDESIINDLPSSEAYHWRKDGLIDYTCVAKGYFLKKCMELINSRFINKDYYINFGGDVLINAKGLSQAKVDYYPFAIICKNDVGIFTSTNFERPNHIPDAIYDSVIVVGSSTCLASTDICATQLICNEYSDSQTVKFKDGKLVGKTYIASPFFNDTDIAIRDRMLDLFNDYIRPDLLNPNIEGDLHKNKDLAHKIRKDNLDAIDQCDYLVFPKDTRDLGTLFEVGYAIRNRKKIIRYDYINNLWEWINQPEIPDLSTLNLDPNDVVLDLNRLGSGVMLGYYHDYLMACYLGTSADNIMLMDNPHIEKPSSLYPCYLPELLSDSTYRLNTIISGS